MTHVDKGKHNNTNGKKPSGVETHAISSTISVVLWDIILMSARALRQNASSVERWVIRLLIIRVMG